MTSFPEQLSAARTSQLDAQFNMLHSLTSQAFDNASRMMALNLAMSRESLERSSRTVRGLLTANDPADLGLLHSHAEEQLRSMVQYGRELFGIASGGMRPVAQAVARPIALLGQAPAETMQNVAAASAPVFDAAAAASETMAPSALEVSDMIDVSDAIDAAAPPAAPSPEEILNAMVQEQALKDQPAVVVNAAPESIPAAPIDAPSPVAKPKPIARAAGKGAPKAATAPYPMAAPVAGQESASVTRIGSTPPKRRK